ncbi:Rrf2 family transcriptional regulator [Desulfoluna sp.]|uniref:RrF2 family transcriptional regulator n=1 Tax=Desulfoluna sp. TaxID=2045199 RepID=UPI0026151791|nr:Rrf2 family transcriptional regulator [Desulfoluna sp.]
MRLSNKSRYAVRVLLELARHREGDPIQVGVISRLQDIPVKFLEQIIRDLKKDGYITSFRGPKGGYKLMADPTAITFGEIVRKFEGETDLVECVTSPEGCKLSDECRVRNIWVDATRNLYKLLDTITIASLLETSGGNLNEACDASHFKREEFY